MRDKKILNRPYKAASLAIALTTWSTLTASPQLDHAVSGQALFSQEGNTTIIQTAQRNTILNFSTFNIGAHEAVYFAQPDAQSRVLNRVTGIGASYIDGNLSSNGAIYLANPAGIFLGHTAVVNAAHFYAVAGQIADTDFLNYNDRFTSLSGSLENNGTIEAASVHLLGRYVENNGTISSSNGYVAIAAGDEVFVGPENSNVYIRMEASAVTALSCVGDDLFGVGDMMGILLSKQSVIRSQTIEVQGNGALIEVNGSLDASSLAPGTPGGTIAITGEFVDIQAATLNANGANGGGTVLIGGDYQGEGDVPTARITRLNSEAVVTADAVMSGDGGKVIAWADEVTLFDGSIFARGGQESGDGGFVETSGQLHLSVQTGVVDTSAPNGAIGNWLLDPQYVTIFQNNPAPTNPVPSLAALSTSDCETYIINVSAIQDAASALTIQTYGASGGCGAPNSITFGTGDVGGDVTLTMTNGVPVTLITEGTAGVVNFHGAITTSGAISIQSDNIVILGPVGMSLSNSTGSITLGSSTVFPLINGTTPGCAFPITLWASGGMIDIWGPVGSAVPGSIGAFNVVDCGQFTMHLNPVIAGSLPPVMHCSSFTMFNSGNTYFPANLDTSATTAGIYGNGGNITISNDRNNHTTSVDMVFQWVIDDVANPGQQIAVNTLSPGDTIISHADIITSGNSPVGLGAGYNAGDIFLEAGRNLYVVNVTASGGNASGGGNFAGGEGGNISLEGAAVYAQGNISATGGAGVGPGPSSLPQIITNSLITNPDGNYGNILFIGDLNVMASDLTIRGNDVTITDVIGNNNIITIDSGPDSVVTIASIAGLDSLVIDNCGQLTVTGPTAVDSLLLNNAAVLNSRIGTFTFEGPVTATDVCTLSNKFAVEFLGGGTITNPTTFYNCGGVVFDGSVTPMMFTGGLDISGNGVATSVTGLLETNNTPMVLGGGQPLSALFIRGDATLATNGGALTLDEAILNGSPGSPGSLTLNMGAAPLNFEGPILFGEVFGGPYLDLNILGTGPTTFEAKNVLGDLTTSTSALTFDTTTAINGTLSCDDITFAPGGYDIAITGPGNQVSGTALFENTGNIDLADVTFANATDTTSGTLRISGGVTLLHGNLTVGNVQGLATANLEVIGGSHVVFGGISPPSTLFCTCQEGFLGFYDLQLATNVVFNAQSSASIVFDGSINGVPYQLTITGPGTVAPNQQITVGSILIDDSQGATGGVTFAKPVTVGTFTQTAGTGATIFKDNLTTTGGAELPGGDVSIVTDGNIISTALIQTTGGTAVTTGQAGGNVALTSNKNSVHVTNIDTSGSAGASGFAGGDAGNITLQPAATFHTGSGVNIPDGFLEIDGTLTALGGSGSPNGINGALSLSPAGRSALMGVATIYSNPTGGDIALNGRTVTVGTNEATTAFGSLTVTTDTSATFGDIVVVDNLSITAPTITLLTHGTGTILAYSGVTYPNPNLHFIAGNTMTLTGNTIYSGPNSLFSQNSFSLSPANQATLQTNLFLSPYALNAYYAGSSTSGDGPGNNPPIPPLDDPAGFFPGGPVNQYLEQANLGLVTEILSEINDNEVWITDENGDKVGYPLPYLKETWGTILREVATSNPIAEAWNDFQTSLPGEQPNAALLLYYLENTATPVAQNALDLLEQLSRLKEMAQNSSLPPEQYAKAKEIIQKVLKPATMTVSQWQELISLTKQLRV